MDQTTSPSVENPIEESATEYLRTHRIPDLFQNLSASLVYNRPGQQIFPDHLLRLTAHFSR